MVSLPLPPLMVSLPPRPQMTSAPLVPLRVSLPAVPVIVQPRLLDTVVVLTAVLLAVFGSVWVADAVVVAVAVPVACGSIVIVIVADADAARVPRVQVTGDVVVQVPCVVVTDVSAVADPVRV